MSGVLPVVIGVFAAAGVWLLAIGIVAARAGDATMLARQRLARQEIGLGQSAVALELEKPLGERLLAPGRRWLTRQMTRLTPAAQATNFRKQLDFVGAPLGLDPAGLQAAVRATDPEVAVACAYAVLPLTRAERRPRSCSPFRVTVLQLVGSARIDAPAG